MHHLDFPKVPVLPPEEPLKEVYVIRDDENPRAPVIIHFLLVNSSFRKFSAPGIPRNKNDQSADFNIFEHPDNVYSTFNFTYDKEVIRKFFLQKLIDNFQSFERLERLMEYNVLNNINVIKNEILEGIQLRRRFRTRCTISKNDIECSSMRETEKVAYKFFNKNIISKNI